MNKYDIEDWITFVKRLEEKNLKTPFHSFLEVLNEIKQPLRKWAKETLGASAFLFLHIGLWDKISLEGEF